MKQLILLPLLFLSNTVFAYENNCTIGKEGSYQTLLIDDRVIDYYGSLEKAVQGFLLLKDAGVCSDKKNSCTIGREGSYTTVIVNNSVIDYLDSLNAAVNELKNLKANGVCD
jgi:hypothetical protein